MGCGVVGECYLWQVECPIPLLGDRQVGGCVKCGWITHIGHYQLVDTTWQKLAEPLVDQHLCYSGSPLVISRDCLSVIWKDICHDKDIPHLILWWLQHGEVNSTYLIWVWSKRMPHAGTGNSLSWVWATYSNALVGCCQERAFCILFTSTRPILDGEIKCSKLCSPTPFCSTQLGCG